MAASAPPGHDARARKSPDKVKAGRAGAQVRWAGHTPRVVRLDALTAEQRRLVHALVEAAREEAATAETPSTANAGGRS